LKESAGAASTRQLIDLFAQVLRQQTIFDPAVRAHIDQLAEVMCTTALSAAPNNPEARVCCAVWNDVLNNAKPVAPDLTEAISNIGGSLPWVDSTAFWGDRLGAAGKRMWFAEVVGPVNARFKAAGRYILAVQVHAAGVTYPQHYHPIIETYYVVAGRADWALDNRDWKELGPGSLVHMSPNRIHGMRTHSEPLLLLSLFAPPFSWECHLV